MRHCFNLLLLWADQFHAGIVLQTAASVPFNSRVYCLPADAAGVHLLVTYCVLPPAVQRINTLRVQTQQMAQIICEFRKARLYNFD